MLRFTLRQLEYFVTAAECGSVAKAAARLNVSQPSVSNAIAKLEGHCGAQLFIRHHAQGISLTQVGRRIVVDARGLLRHARELQRNAEAAGGLIGGELELGCFVTLAPVFMPVLITEFSKLHPEVEIKLKEGLQDELVAGLVSGKFELAFLYDLELHEGIEVETLASFQPYVLLPDDHKLARQRKISLDSLRDEPLILLDVPPSRNYFMGLFRSAGIEPRIAFSSPSIEMVRGLVGSKRGYSLLVTRPYGDRSYDGRRIVARPIADKVAAGDVCLARLGQTRPTRLMDAFSDFCRQWFSRYRPAGFPHGGAP